MFFFSIGVNKFACVQLTTAFNILADGQYQSMLL